MIHILNIGGEPIFDDRIVKIETHTYNPYANTTVGYSGEIRIPIQHQDLYMLPCESFLYVEGKWMVRKGAEGRRVILGNNCVTFMFDELRYELDGVEIDRNRNVGITSTIKIYVSLTAERGKIVGNAAWNMSHNAAEAYFNFCVPLNILLGFCEDYKRIVINARHELILIRSRNDNNCIFGNATAEADIELFKIQWRMPHYDTKSDIQIPGFLNFEHQRFIRMVKRHEREIGEDVWEDNSDGLHAELRRLFDLEPYKENVKFRQIYLTDT
ncbi:uncharacterized protein [Polyergus mexicanus]|uniref:uncharacterized protein n=1 Tax=Polyergus mexicanus TaxID=615972 RepID=UPI0038B4F5E9